MSKVIDFSDKKSDKEFERRKNELFSSRCEKIRSLLAGKTITSVDCVSEETFVLNFNSGASLNISISPFVDIDEVLF